MEGTRVVAVLVLLAGCAQQGEPSVAGVVAELDRAADLCAYEPFAPFAPPAAAEVPHWSEVVDRSERACRDGEVRLAHTVIDRLDATTTWYDLTFDAFAQPGGYRIVADEADVIDPLEGLDDCSVVVWPRNVVETVGEAKRPLDWAAEVQVGGERLQFDHRGGRLPLDVLGLQPAAGTSASLTVLVDASAPMRLDGAAVLPPELELLSPQIEPGMEIPRDALALEWTGGVGLHHLGIEVWATRDDGVERTIFCDVVDDGAFTVPAALMAELPADSWGLISLVREEERRLGLSDGRVIEATARRSVGRYDLSFGP